MKKLLLLFAGLCMSCSEDGVTPDLSKTSSREIAYIAIEAESNCTSPTKYYDTLYIRANTDIVRYDVIKKREFLHFRLRNDTVFTHSYTTNKVEPYYTVSGLSLLPLKTGLQSRRIEGVAKSLIVGDYTMIERVQSDSIRLGSNYVQKVVSYSNIRNPFLNEFYGTYLLYGSYWSLAGISLLHEALPSVERVYDKGNIGMFCNDDLGKQVYNVRWDYKETPVSLEIRSVGDRVEFISFDDYKRYWLRSVTIVYK